MDEQMKKLSEDPNRAAYMIAWRDRYIAKLEEIKRGHEEERRMLDCLLFYALFGMAKGEQGEEQREVLISREALQALLGAWRCRTEQVDGGYRVCFEAVGEGERASDGQSQEG